MRRLLGQGWAGPVILMEIISLGTYLALPSFRDAAARDRAAQVVDEIDLVCRAASTARAKTGEWPEDGAPGRAPESLRTHLPKDFSFDRRAYRLDWDHWWLSGEPMSSASRREYLAVTVIARDARLAQGIIAAMGSKRPHFTVGDRVSFVIVDPQGSMP